VCVKKVLGVSGHLLVTETDSPLGDQKHQGPKEGEAKACYMKECDTKKEDLKGNICTSQSVNVREYDVLGAI